MLGTRREVAVLLGAEVAVLPRRHSLVLQRRKGCRRCWQLTWHPLRGLDLLQSWLASKLVATIPGTAVQRRAAAIGTITILSIGRPSLLGVFERAIR